MTYKKRPRGPYEQKRSKKVQIPKKHSNKDFSDPTSKMSSSAASNDEAFKREEEAFEKLKQRHINDKRLKGKFIAVVDGKLVDCDENDRDLAKRVYDKFGYRPVYIGKIAEKRRVVDLPSPELV